MLEVDELNSFMKNDWTQSKWVTPLEKGRILKVLDFLSKLVKGEITTNAGDEIDYDF